MKFEALSKREKTKDQRQLICKILAFEAFEYK